MKNEEERVINLLRDAFAGNLTLSHEMSHEDCLELRIQLPALNEQSLKRALPQVLIDLVYTHTGDYHITENVEVVIWFLIPYLDSDETTMDADATYLRNQQTAIFNSFSKEQVYAISAWLDLARNWEDLSLRREQVEEAFTYWDKKFKNNPPSTSI